MKYQVRTYPNTRHPAFNPKVMGITLGAVLAAIFLTFILFGPERANITGNVVSNPDNASDNTNTETEPTSGIPQTYSINKIACGTAESGRIRRAFSIISEQTEGIANLTEVDGNGDVKIDCFTVIPSHIKYSGIGGALTESEGRTVKLYGINAESNDKFPGGCSTYPNSEIREILHNLGFFYSTDRYSIMYGVAPGCLVKNIDKDIVDSLKTMYS